MCAVRENRHVKCASTPLTRVKVCSYESEESSLLTSPTKGSPIIVMVIMVIVLVKIMKH